MTSVRSALFMAWFLILTLVMAVIFLPLGPALIVLPLLGAMLNGTSSVLYGTVPELAKAAPACAARQKNKWGAFAPRGRATNEIKACRLPTETPTRHCGAGRPFRRGRIRGRGDRRPG